jgi:hypothetical protein
MHIYALQLAQVCLQFHRRPDYHLRPIITLEAEAEQEEADFLALVQ